MATHSWNQNNWQTLHLWVREETWKAHHFFSQPSVRMCNSHSSGKRLGVYLQSVPKNPQGGPWASSAGYIQLRRIFIGQIGDLGRKTDYRHIFLNLTESALHSDLMKPLNQTDWPDRTWWGTSSPARPPAPGFWAVEAERRRCLPLPAALLRRTPALRRRHPSERFGRDNWGNQRQSIIGSGRSDRNEAKQSKRAQRRPPVQPVWDWAPWAGKCPNESTLKKTTMCSCCIPTYKESKNGILELSPDPK